MAFLSRPKYAPYLYQEPEPYYKQYIRKLLRQGHSPVIVFVGKTRRGKSLGAYALGKWAQHVLNRRAHYTVDKNMHFGVRNFMLGFQHAQRQAHVDDEAGEELKGKNHWDDFNSAINSILETQAYRQNVIIFCLPVFRRLWEGHREHVDMVFNMVGKQAARVSEIVVKHDEITQQKYIYRRVMDNYIRMPDVPDEEVAAFKKKERAAKEDIYQKWLDHITGTGDSEEEEFRDVII